MLPETLSSSYRRYKEDTNVFMTWLGRAAEACGYKSDASKASETAPPTSSSKASKAKRGKRQEQVPPSTLAADDYGVASVKHAISTKELAAQVDAISQSKVNIRMPDTIKNYLRLAIEARQRCSNWYENARHEAEVYDQGGHRFFIKVLQDALAKLGGGEISNASTKPAVKKSSDKDGKITGIENRFSHLDIDDTDDSYHLTPIEAALATSDKKQPQPKSVDVFELEAEQAFEKAFTVFCFFEDLHRIQEKLKETWKHCGSGKIDLLTATIVTDAAVCMIRRAEQDLCSTFFPSHSDDDCYASFAGMMFLMECITKGTDPKNAPGVDVTPFDGFIFLPTARTLMKFIHMVNMNIAWPPPIVPLRFNYLHAPHKADMPEHKKLQHDDQILSQLLIDLELPDRAMKYARGKCDISMAEPVVKDIFSRTLQPVWVEGKLSVAAVVIAQTILDISDVCNELQNFPKLVTHTNAYASKSFDFQMLEGGIMKTGGLNWPNSGTGTLFTVHALQKRINMPTFPLMKNLMLQIRQTPKMYTWANVPDAIKKNLDVSSRPPPGQEAAFQNMNVDFINPAPEDDFAIIRNPMYSGGIILKLLLQYQEAGISLANHHMSIFVIAHLYNTLRQLKMLDKAWPVMDSIIELHKRAIFAGVIPTTTKDMADRLSYRLDLQRKQKRFHEEKYEFREPTQTQMLRSLLDPQLSAGQMLWQIEQQIEQPKGPNKPSRAGQRQKQQLSPEVFLKKVREMTSQTVSNVSIDYIRLTKRCVKLLEDFRRMWNVMLQSEGVPVRYDPCKEGTNTNDPGLVLVCRDALEEAKAVRNLGVYTYRAGDGDVAGAKGMNPDPLDANRHGMGVLVASKVFKSFLAREDTDFRFPLATRDAVDVVDTSVKPPWIVHRITSPDTLYKLLETTTYVAVNFFADYDDTHVQMAMAFADLSHTHGVPGVLAFARANRDDVPEVAKKYCKGDAKQQTFVFFKDGKQVAVNGKQVVLGSDKAGLEAAVGKLGELAKKRMALKT
ncbi:hypothetical protein F4781DRAFT_117785 [Annulohypoxylon bovei var. microspora]|nr:hypothetical protein F4781DRAFT_117785 [Annulohypoxylon bovei var. microspora]